MKTFSIIILFLFIAVASASGQSTKKAEHGAYFADFYVMEVKPMQFEISYKYPKTDRVLVRVRDDENNTIFVEKKLVYKRYHKYFDLSTMRDGRYTFELTDGDEQFSQSFVVTTKTLRVATAL